MKNLNTFKLLSDYESEKSGGVLNTPNVSFVTEDGSVRYLLENEDPYNGHEYVDLGLPSGLKWATCNVGATSPEQAGLYFAWGETTGYTAEQVEAGERVFSSSVYNAGSAASISADLTLEQDAAHAYLGGKWRMPTKAEIEELINSSYTTQTWTYDYNRTMMRGNVITSKINGNSVFFPAAGFCINSSVTGVRSAGYYWSVSWYDSHYAWYQSILDEGVDVSDLDRYYGFSVRGVCE